MLSNIHDEYERIFFLYIYMMIVIIDISYFLVGSFDERKLEGKLELC